MFTGLRVRDYRSFVDSTTVPLSALTVVVGRNNTGKSTLLRAVYQVQDGAPWSDSDVRIGATGIRIDLDFDMLPVPPFLDPGSAEKWGGGQLNLTRAAKGISSIGVTHPDLTDESRNFDLVPSQEPRNLIYPSLSERHSNVRYEEQVRREATTSVQAVEMNIVSRASTLFARRTAEGAEFAGMCEQVLGDTLDLMTAENGQRLGIQVTRYDQIALQSMGTGVGRVLGILVNLAGARNKVFLIEEPENDLHPQALKALLDIIVEKSAVNQFIITTHSSIVLTRIGSADGATVLHTKTDGGLPPTTAVTPIVGRAGRLDVLRDLGYGLADLDLADGWLIFEEATAERICRQYLIPWFAPKLARLTTIAAAGTSRVGPLVTNLHEMALYAHLQPGYEQRLWVITDGDASGCNAVEELRRRYATWPSSRFRFWDRDNFEEYYPSEFQSQVTAALELPHDSRAKAKKDLLDDLLAWIDANGERARDAFESSAATAIDHLREIEASLA